MGNSGVKVRTSTDRALEKILTGQEKPVFLICATEKGQAYNDSPVADSANTGDGTITGVSVSESATKSETFTLECITAVTNGGTFKVTGDISGLQTAQATVGSAYNSDGSEIGFTINDGVADFAAGDKFTIKTYATKINLPTPVASLTDFDDWYGKVTSGGNITLAGVAFKSDDYARAMVIAAVKNGAPGGLFVVSAKALGITRATVSNAEYQVAIDSTASNGQKIIVHESINSADQIDLAQFAFDQSTPDTAKFTFAFFALGAGQALSAYTTRSAAIDGGVSRGNYTDEPTPYGLVSPCLADENGNVSTACAVAGAVAVVCKRAWENDPAMPIITLELQGFGGLESDWLDGTTSEHDLLNAAGVTTLKTIGSRVKIHRVVSCIQNTAAQATQYASWHDEPGVWINFFIRNDLLNIFSSSPYDRTKNTQEIRELMTGDVRQRLRMMEAIEWVTSRGAGIVENVNKYEGDVLFEAHPTDANKAKGTFTYDTVNALYGIDITAHVIV